jgi:hypothetical protein
MCAQRSPYNWSEQLHERHQLVECWTVLAGLVVVLSRRWTFAPCLPFQTFREYLRDTVLPALKDRYDEFLLTELVKRWEHHKIMNKWMFRFFMYLVSGVWYCLCECSPVFGLTRGGAVLRTATIASITTCQLLKNLVRWRAVAVAAGISVIV